MTTEKWKIYERLKALAGKVLGISQGSDGLWQQHEQICEECESVAGEICEE